MHARTDPVVYPTGEEVMRRRGFIQGAVAAIVLASRDLTRTPDIGGGYLDQHKKNPIVWVRHKIREDGFMRKLMPPEKIS